MKLTNGWLERKTKDQWDEDSVNFEYVEGNLFVHRSWTVEEWRELYDLEPPRNGEEWECEVEL